MNHAIQTNGLLTDDQWAEFFAENGFLVGVSLDGKKQLHDTYRVDAQGKGTHSRVMRAIQILKNHNVEFNILSVLTEQGARNIRSTYGFLRETVLRGSSISPVWTPSAVSRDIPNIRSVLTALRVI